MELIAAQLASGRLVTLTGAGGVGKTRLAVEVARRRVSGFADGVRYVDLAPVTDADVVPHAVAAALLLPDQLGRSTMDVLTRYVAGRRMLLVLDNCEHLLGAAAEVILALLAAGSDLTILATSREPLGVVGEVTWRVPSLSLRDEAVELFYDRARCACPDLGADGNDRATVVDICLRLDGIPLAIELAAARLRALTVVEVRDSLHDRFRLLTGGARTTVRRQQTLRASVDWSYSLLTELERILFRRLAAFLGGFDLDAARAICDGHAVERYQVLDQLSLLVDKSLVAAERVDGRTRYRLLETVRQYAQEKLVESGEAQQVRNRHLDHYAALATHLDAPGQIADERRVDRAAAEIDNLRAAFAWSRESCRSVTALRLASALQPLWLNRGQIREGLAWLDAALADVSDTDPEIAAARVAALADQAVLLSWTGLSDSVEQAEWALAAAGELGDPALLTRALAGRGCISAYDAEQAAPYFVEGIELARQLGDGWRLSQMLGWVAYGAIMSGDPASIKAAAREGLSVAKAVGHQFQSRQCRWALAMADIYLDLPKAIDAFRELIDEASAANDSIFSAIATISLSYALAFRGETTAALTAARTAIEESAGLVGFYEGIGYSMLTAAALAAGDPVVAWDASESAWARTTSSPVTAGIYIVYSAEAALACGDLASARQWSDDAVAITKGWHLAAALTARARIAQARGEHDQAECDAHRALAVAADSAAFLWVPDNLEILAAQAVNGGSSGIAGRFLGAANALRRRIGSVRFRVYDAGAEECAANVRDGLGDDFDVAWSEGAALSPEQMIAYARRGRGERKRPPTGWESLTPTERDVVRLVVDGLGNKDIAARLFVSHRTIQTHLTHVYAKLGLTSRVALAQEAGRRLSSEV